MRGPLHYVADKFGPDLNEMVRTCEEPERSKVRAVLKLQIGMYGLIAATGIYGIAESHMNISSDSNAMAWQATAHIVDAFTKTPTLAMTVFGVWTGIEAAQLHHQLKAPPTEAVTNLNE